MVNNTEIKAKIKTNSNKNGRKRDKIKRLLPSFLILILALIINYFLYDSFKENIHNLRNIEFNKATQSIQTRFINLISTELGILKSIGGLYNILPQVTKDYFEIYGTVPLETYKSITSLSYIMPLEDRNVNTFLFDQYAIGYYYYEIYPEGRRKNYNLVQMMVPFTDYENERLLGYDIKTSEVINSSFNKAKETGEPACSDFLNFEIHNNILTAFIFYPIFEKKNNKKEFKGALALEINIKKFFVEALQGGSAFHDATFPSDSKVYFKISEKRSNGELVNVFESKNFDKYNKGDNPEFTETEIIYIADKQLEIEFYSNSFFGGDQQALLPVIFLVLSLIFSFLLFGFVYSILTTKANLQKYTDKISLSLKSILEHTQDLVVTVDYSGNIIEGNKVFLHALKINHNEIETENIIALVDSEKNKFELSELLSNKSSSVPIEKSLYMRKKIGGDLLVNWTIISLDGERHFLMIGSKSNILYKYKTKS